MKSPRAVVRSVVHGLCVAAALLAGWVYGRHWVGYRTCIVGSSMEPALADGGWARAQSLFIWQTINRGDIVTLQEDDAVVVKRVIGIPGDSVRMRLGFVFLNGTRLDENYVPENVLTPASDAGDVLVAGPDEFIVMGDNRWESFDSRQFGPVPRNLILGRITVRTVPRHY